jgi:hypothetical protein
MGKDNSIVSNESSSQGFFPSVQPKKRFRSRKIRSQLLNDSLLFRRAPLKKKLFLKIRGEHFDDRFSSASVCDDAPVRFGRQLLSAKPAALTATRCRRLPSKCFADAGVEAKATGCVCRRIAQNAAQPILANIM